MKDKCKKGYSEIKSLEEIKGVCPDKCSWFDGNTLGDFVFGYSYPEHKLKSKEERVKIRQLITERPSFRGNKEDYLKIQ